jgi:chemotaxis protein CheZ
MEAVPARWANLATWIDAMSAAIRRDDEAALRAAITRFDEARNGALLGEIRKVTEELQGALDRFSVDSRLTELAEREVPDAHQRLAHVLRLTDDAAHRTMDLVELCGPLAEQTGAGADALLAAWPTDAAAARASLASVEAFLEQAVLNMATVRNSLSEVLLAQGYQDLSGQIIRGVMNLVAELEVALGELIRLAGGGQDDGDVDGQHGAQVRGNAGGQSAGGRSLQGNGHGPVIPGLKSGGAAVTGQQDVDALLANLGM